MILGFGNTTVNPTIVVRASKDLCHQCTFGVPGEQIEVSAIEKKYQLKGTQFPGQEIKIRWWPVDKSNHRALLTPPPPVPKPVSL
jgi:hypothetical protein